MPCVPMNTPSVELEWQCDTMRARVCVSRFFAFNDSVFPNRVLSSGLPRDLYLIAMFTLPDIMNNLIRSLLLVLNPPYINYSDKDNIAYKT